MALYRTYKAARVIEAIIENELGDDDPTVSSYPWHNGRENGFAFTSWGHHKEGDEFTEEANVHVYVAECRNSDQLTVTLAKHSEWDMVTDAEYKARESFPYNEYAACASRVLQLLGLRETVTA